MRLGDARLPDLRPLGVNVVPSTALPPGDAYMFGGDLIVGIGSRNHTEARIIVREGMAETLRWLGQPVQPLSLRIARAHYRLDVKVCHVGADGGALAYPTVTVRQFE